MKQYIVMRLSALIITLFIVAVIGFFTIHLTPGDPASIMLGPAATDQQIAELRSRMGLDLPVHVQFGRWISLAVRGDLGHSIFLNRSVTRALIERMEPTFLLGALSLIVSLLIAIPSGVTAAIRHNSIVDQVVMGFSVIGLSMPSFWLSLNLILLFAVWLRWLPVAGYVRVSESLLLALRSLILPSVTLGFIVAAPIARMTRSCVLEVLSQDYVRTARSKGLAERQVIYGHVLRNAMIPVLTSIGLGVGVLLSGTVIVETVFALPGLGQLVVSSVLRRDYPMIQGILLFMALAYMCINLLVDILYVHLDCRIKY